MIRKKHTMLSRWLAIFAILMFPIVAGAQTDQSSDSAVEERVTTDEDTTFLEEPATADTMIFRATPDSTIKRLQNEKAFAYANNPEYWKKKRQNSRNVNINLSPLSGLFSYLLIGVFLAVLAYVVFKLLTDNNIILFKRKKKIIGESIDMAAEADTANLPALIRDAEQNGAFRLATRYRYMWLLQELDTRQLIRMHPELTNWDYILQLGSHPLNQKFRYLTTAYEYTWYGEFELNNNQYDLIRKKFESFLH